MKKYLVFSSKIDNSYIISIRGLKDITLVPDLEIFKNLGFLTDYYDLELFDLVGNRFTYYSSGAIDIICKNEEEFKKFSKKLQKFE